MAAEPEYQTGTTEPGSSADALPQGGATQLEETTSEAPIAPEEEAAVEEAMLPEPAMPGDNEPEYVAESEDDDFLTGPTLRPDESQAVGIPTGSAGIPASVIRNLPMLQRLASEPDADPQLVTLVKLVLRELGR